VCHAPYVDANVLVYAFDASAGPKQRAARALLERLWERNTGCLPWTDLNNGQRLRGVRVRSPFSAEE
jgi:hypothetical protein